MSWEEALDEARDYWRSLSQEERDEELAQLAAEAEALRENPDEIKSQILKESIEPIDWLFIGLGVFIAFGVGSGSEWLSSDD
jgi:acyl-CoA reductase-like NAD-dependent aldehyde dehydrogenase